MASKPTSRARAMAEETSGLSLARVRGNVRLAGWLGEGGGSFSRAVYLAESLLVPRIFMD